MTGFRETVVTNLSAQWKREEKEMWRKAQKRTNELPVGQGQRTDKNAAQLIKEGN